MTEAQLTRILLVLALIAMGTIIAVVRSVLREMRGGLGDEDESQAARPEKQGKTPAEKLNDRKLTKEIERRRSGQ